MTTEPVTVSSTLRESLRAAHWVLEQTVSGVTDALANQPAEGLAHPVGSLYAHALLAEDGFVQGLLQGRPPLFAAEWAGRTGADRAMPLPGMVEGNLKDWYDSVVVEMDQCRVYGQAVCAASDAFLEAASPEVLNRSMDMSFAGMGTLPLAIVFGIFVLGHVNNLVGEISAVKGFNGMQGYPY